MTIKQLRLWLEAWADSLDIKDSDLSDAMEYELGLKIVDSKKIGHKQITNRPTLDEM